MTGVNSQITAVEQSIDDRSFATACRTKKTNTDIVFHSMAETVGVFQVPTQTIIYNELHQ
jgi:hypothetical protein